MALQATHGEHRCGGLASPRAGQSVSGGASTARLDERCRSIGRRRAPQVEGPTPRRLHPRCGIYDMLMCGEASTTTAVQTYKDIRLVTGQAQSFHNHKTRSAQRVLGATDTCRQRPIGLRGPATKHRAPTHPYRARGVRRGATRLDPTRCRHLGTGERARPRDLSAIANEMVGEASRGRTPASGSSILYESWRARIQSGSDSELPRSNSSGNGASRCRFPKTDDVRQVPREPEGSPSTPSGLIELASEVVRIRAKRLPRHPTWIEPIRHDA